MAGYYDSRYRSQYTPLLESQRRQHATRPGGRRQDQQLAGWQRAASEYAPGVGAGLGTALGGLAGAALASPTGVGIPVGAGVGATIGGGLGGAIGQAASGLFGTMADDTMGEHDEYEMERQARLDAIRSLMPYL